MDDPVGELRVNRTGDRGEILMLTIDRPNRRNAIDQGLADQIARSMVELETAPGLRVGILTGSGSFFSAGTDLALGASPSTPDGGEYGFVRRSRTRPLIAAVEGFALGGGFEMAMACDLVVAADDASFGLPETLRGVVPNCGALFRGPALLTPNVTLELLLTGQRLGAPRAHQLGFVNRLTAAGDAIAGAMELAAEILLASPAAVAASMRAVAAARQQQEEALWRLTTDAAAEAAQSPDHDEGIVAFFEKRAPRWA